MGQSSPKLVSWAAKDGRSEDLIYHISTCGPDGLKATAGSEKKRTPLHLAAIGGYIECISILYDAGKSYSAVLLSIMYNFLALLSCYNCNFTRCRQFHNLLAVLT